MSNTLQTELQLRVTGVAESVNGIRQVGAASQQLGGGLDTYNAKLAKFAGHLGGAGRYEFMFLSGLSTALDESNGSFRRFAASLGNTAMYAGAAAAVSGLTITYQKLSEAADEYNKVAKDVGDTHAGNANVFKLWAYGMLRTFNLGDGNAAWSQLGLGNPQATKLGINADRNLAVSERLAASLWKENMPESAMEMWKGFVKMFGELNPENIKNIRDIAPTIISQFKDRERDNRLWESLAERDDAAAKFAKAMRGSDLWNSLGETDSQRLKAVAASFSEREKMRGEIMQAINHDISRGPQYAGMITSGSYDERKLLDRSSWQETWKDELKTANTYLATIAAKVGTTEVYGF